MSISSAARPGPEVRYLYLYVLAHDRRLGRPALRRYRFSRASGPAVSLAGLRASAEAIRAEIAKALRLPGVIDAVLTTQDSVAAMGLDESQVVGRASADRQAADAYYAMIGYREDRAC
jgi:hypothetical protein